MKNILTQDWQILKEDANKIISKIDVLNLNNDDYVMLGACVAILDHPVVESSETMETPVQDAPAVPQSKSYADIIRNLISNVELFSDMNENDIAKQTFEHAKYFLSKLKAQAVTPEDKAFVRDTWTHLNLIRQRLE